MKNPAYYISAYTSSPSPVHWSSTEEAAYFEALAEDPRIIGIEHPFMPHTSRYPIEWLVSHLPTHWQLCITTVPLFMTLAQEQPHMGLASVDSHGRQIAVDKLKELNQYVETLHHHFARPVVKAIHLQTFPRQPAGKSSVDSLAQSLTALQQMNWHGVELNIEHCDAYIPGQVSEKGLLTLSDEIKIIHQIGGYGIILNWARSAIEYRSASGPIAHIDSTIAHDLLRGFFFSGCSAQVNAAYGQWQDTHMPPCGDQQSLWLPQTGLLDREAIHATWRALSAASSPAYLGIKITDRGHEPSVVRSIGLLQESMNVLSR